MYKYKFTKQVEKFLQKQSKDFLQLFSEKLEILIKNPYSNNLDIKALKWLDNNYRLRIGKYRFLYEIIDEEISIYFYKAWSRWDIYK